MAKPKTVYVCENCGTDHPKWQGQCRQCGEWNTLVEEVRGGSSGGMRSGLSSDTGSEAGLGAAGQMMAATPIPDDKKQTLAEVQALKSSKKRISSRISELDRVLGGGIVPGAVMLVGGEPGIGKSTLLTQVALLLAASDEDDAEGTENDTKASSKSDSDGKGLTKQNPNKKSSIFYVCGEENASQIGLRIGRYLDSEYKNDKKEFGGSSVDEIKQNMLFISSTDTDQLVSSIRADQPRAVIVDSIQTLSSQDLTGAAGSIGQLRTAADRLTSVAKQTQTPIFLVGHVTKDGTIAGPKVLEHIVDTVVEVSGDRTGQLRLVRTIKNRFGPTDEVGVFRMQAFGMEAVENPSEIFLEQTAKDVAGSATVCVMEGTRPLLIEVQALVNPTQLAMPRRVGRGVELSRIQVLAAVLQKHCNVPLGTQDIFLSAAGGMNLKEPAVDLGLSMAVVSSYSNTATPQKTVFIGEIGLQGEIRSVSHQEQRVKEAKRLGYKHIISRESHTQIRDVLKDLGLK